MSLLANFESLKEYNVVKISKFIYGCVAVGALNAGAALQAQAVVLTFDDGTTGSSAETHYTSYGVTFSGGGLLADGASGGVTGQPEFTNYTGTGEIGTLEKAFASGSGGYNDSFFDIWVHFSAGGASGVTGDYVGNLGYGGTITAYDAGGGVLGTVYLPNVSVGGVGTIGSFSFSPSGPIAKLHMISDGAAAATYLDNLGFSLVPEPSTMALLTIGLAGFSFRRAKLKV